jgi:DNA-binding IclR family transcriptional regulator
MAVLYSGLRRPIREYIRRLYMESILWTITDTSALLKVLDQVREQGYGEDNEEQEEGLRCILPPGRATPAALCQWRCCTADYVGRYANTSAGCT